MSEEVWTIKRLLDWTTDYFRQIRSETARLDAEILLSAALDCQRIDLYTRFDQIPPVDRRVQFRNWVQRRADGEPVAYLVGRREFFSLDFAVTPDVLIPRPETEHVVVECLDLMNNQFAKLPRVLIADVGTGSGNIAIALAKTDPRAQVLATDKHPEALQIAMDNAKRHGVENQIEFRQADLLESLDDSAVFQITASNPPYVGQDEQTLLDGDVRDHEPKTALFAEGPVGTETIARLIRQAPKRLVEGGFLVIEISPMISDPTRQLLESDDNFVLTRIIKDLAGHDRVVVAERR